MANFLSIYIIMFNLIYLVEQSAGYKQIREPETVLEDSYGPLKSVFEDYSKKLINQIRSIIDQTAEDGKDDRKNYFQRLKGQCIDETKIVTELNKRGDSLMAYIKSDSLALKKSFKNELDAQIDSLSQSCEVVQSEPGTTGQGNCKDGTNLKNVEAKLAEMTQLLKKDNLDIRNVKEEQQNFAKVILSQEIILKDIQKTIETLKHSFAFLPRTCMDHKRKGFSMTGVYTVYPSGKAEEPLEVKCDMQEEGGGWMIFLEREKNERDASTHEEFNRTWHEYEDGFGRLTGEHWLGLKWLNYFTTNQNFEMKVKVRTAEGGKFWAKYDIFRVFDHTKDYKLHVSGFKGNLDYDALGKVNKDAPFSTWDRDKDLLGQKNCASDNGGGWWYVKCHKGLLTATHATTKQETQKTLRWFHRGKWIVITQAIMEIREKSLNNN